MIKQIIFYILFYIYKIWKIIFYIDKKFLDIIANPSVYFYYVKMIDRSKTRALLKYICVVQLELPSIPKSQDYYIYFLNKIENTSSLY